MSGIQKLGKIWEEAVGTAMCSIQTCAAFLFLYYTTYCPESLRTAIPKHLKAAIHIHFFHWKSLSDYLSQIHWGSLEFHRVFLSSSPSTSIYILFLDLRCVLWVPFISPPSFLWVIPLMFLAASQYKGKHGPSQGDLGWVISKLLTKFSTRKEISRLCGKFTLVVIL